MPYHVITAGPSAGKSSVIRELSARGYTTRPEGARLVLDQAISEGKDVASLKQDPAFHEMVEDRDIQILDNTSDDEHVFFDRSIIDNIAYRQLAGNEPVPTRVMDAVDMFDTVFVLERLPFKEDEARAGDDEEWAQTVHQELKDVYRELGFTLNEIPVMPVDERTDRIENIAVRGPGVIH